MVMENGNSSQVLNIVLTISGKMKMKFLHKDLGIIFYLFINLTKHFFYFVLIEDYVHKR